LVSPGAASPLNRYTGQPATVTCRSKSGRTTLPTSALSTPSMRRLPVSMSGGQRNAQSSRQVTFVGRGLSFSNRYSV
jgi:hypothetical protein